MTTTTTMNKNTNKNITCSICIEEIVGSFCCTSSMKIGKTRSDTEVYLIIGFVYFTPLDYIGEKRSHAKQIVYEQYSEVSQLVQLWHCQSYIACNCEIFVLFWCQISTGLNDSSRLSDILFKILQFGITQSSAIITTCMKLLNHTF